ncbi:hypothetical protein PAMP_008545 [Pampus punctatissimus]
MTKMIQKKEVNELMEELFETFELDLLAQRGDLLMSPGVPGFCSSFRASNLQEALQLLEELRQAPITYLPHERTPDARGYKLLPSVSLDPALYCPRRTAAFTGAEDR